MKGNLIWMKKVDVRLDETEVELGNLRKAVRRVRHHQELQDKIIEAQTLPPVDGEAYKKLTEALSELDRVLTEERLLKHRIVQDDRELWARAAEVNRQRVKRLLEQLETDKEKNDDRE